MASNPHATPQDTIAALRTRYTGELAVADAATPGPWEGRYDDGDFTGYYVRAGKSDKHPHGRDICDVKDWDDAESEITCDFIAAARESVPRDARLKLALLDQVERALCRAEQADIDAAAAVGLDEVAARVHVAYKTEERVALATLRLLAESAGEAVAW